MSLFKSNRVISIDMGASDVKLAEFMIRKKVLELVNVAVKPLGMEPGTDADLAPYIKTAIKDAMREKKIRPAPVALSLTGQSAFLRGAKLPPVKKDKVYQTVQYEAQQNVPFPINEVVWDYQLMGSSESELNVMLVAIKADIVEGITDSLEEIGLRPEIVDVAPMALYNAVRYNYSELTGCTLIIDIGARSTNLVFMEEGRFFSRNLPIVGTGNAITQQLMKEFDMSFKDAEELKCQHASVAFGGAYEDYADKVVSRVSKTVRSAMTRLHVEVERSINFYCSQQGGHPPNQVLLAGGTSVIARTDEFFKEKLKINVEYLNPFRNVVVSEKIPTEEIGACAHVMGESVGVALRYALPCPLEINLLPPKIVAEKAFRKKQPFLIMAGVSLVLVVLCWWMYFSQMSAVTVKRTDQVQTKVNELEMVETRLKAVESKIAGIRGKAEELADVVYQRTQWMEVLDEVHANMLDGMWLVSLTPQMGGPSTATAAAGRRDRGGAVPSAKPAASGSKYSRFLVKGFIFADRANDSAIRVFRDRLRASKFFTEDTEIKQMAPMGKEDVAREFIIEIVLKKPL